MALAALYWHQGNKAKKRNQHQKFDSKELYSEEENGNNKNSFEHLVESKKIVSVKVNEEEQSYANNYSLELNET